MDEKSKNDIRLRYLNDLSKKLVRKYNLYSATSGCDHIATSKEKFVVFNSIDIYSETGTQRGEMDYLLWIGIPVAFFGYALTSEFHKRIAKVGISTTKGQVLLEDFIDRGKLPLIRSIEDAISDITRVRVFPADGTLIEDGIEYHRIAWILDGDA